ncbi:MAG: ferric reductase-like transmembrane domain-containing protein [Nanoarchaeota archaeon]
MAFKLLVFISIIKPIIKIFNLRNFEKYLIFRKELGVIVFYLAFFHSLIIFYITDFNYYLAEKLIFNNFGYLFGLIALIILFLLFITSNNLSMKILKKNWKNYII